MSKDLFNYHPDELDEISLDDKESLPLIYQCLVNAAVETRKDLDQIAFRYIATLTTFTVAVASENVTLQGIFSKTAAAVIVLVLVGVSFFSLVTRNKVYSALNHGLINIEVSLGMFQEGRFIKDGALFDLSQWRSKSSRFVFDQVTPHLFGVPAVGVICILVILADEIFI